MQLNSYLKDFPAHNGNPTQPLNADELLDILEFRVPARLVQVCGVSKGQSKGENPSKLKTAGKRKAEVSTTPTTSPA
eukprot:5023818-Ditylum_brightwellii.AAC.1